MKVLIAGSFYHDPDHPSFRLHGQHSEFLGACRDLGRRLARSGASVMVQHDDERYADTEVVRGFLEAAPNLPASHCGRVHIVLPQSALFRPFEQLARGSGSTFVTYQELDAISWNAARIRAATREANTVVVIGGSAKSEMTGVAALAAGKSVIPIASFGGAAERLLQVISQSQAAGVPTTCRLAPSLLGGFWSSQLGDAIEQLATRHPTVVIVHGRDLAARDQLHRYLVSELSYPSDAILVMGLTDGFGSTLPSKWNELASTADAAIVVASADDSGQFLGASGEPSHKRARQNVWLELGWFWGRFMNLKRVLILAQHSDSEPLELPSDLSGIEVHRWSNRIEEQSSAIRRFLAHIRGAP